MGNCIGELINPSELIAENSRLRSRAESLGRELGYMRLNQRLYRPTASDWARMKMHLARAQDSLMVVEDILFASDPGHPGHIDTQA